MPGGQGKAGGRGGRENDAQGGLAPFHLTNEFQGDKHFADTHGVNPGPAAATQFIPHPRRIETESLAEFMAVLSPLEHPEKETRQQGHQHEGEGQIVKKTNRSHSDVGEVSDLTFPVAARANQRKHTVRRILRAGEAFQNQSPAGGKGRRQGGQAEQF